MLRFSAACYSANVRSSSTDSQWVFSSLVKRNPSATGFRRPSWRRAMVDHPVNHDAGPFECKYSGPAIHRCRSAHP